jgi:nucleotide-binding universal stress UspA family protein
LAYKYRRESGQALSKPFERPLLVAEESPAGQCAATLLKGLKGVVQEIHVIHVAGGRALKEPSAMKIQETRKTSIEKLDALCAEFEAAGIRARPHLYIGKPGVEIEKGARELGATLIVMGASGKAGWQEKVLGSLHKELSKKSEFPLLVVPSGQGDNSG